MEYLVYECHGDSFSFRILSTMEAALSRLARAERTPPMLPPNMWRMGVREVEDGKVSGRDVASRGFMHVPEWRFLQVAMALERRPR